MDDLSVQEVRRIAEFVVRSACVFVRRTALHAVAEAMRGLIVTSPELEEMLELKLYTRSRTVRRARRQRRLFDPRRCRPLEVN
jgi:hypothetical protein